MNLARHLLAIPALAFALLGSQVCAHAQPVDAAAIRTLAAHPLLPSAPHPWDGTDWLNRFYAARGYAPAWPAAQARAALALIDQAPTDGLDPIDYRVSTGGGAAYDVALTAAMLHFLADLRLGRVRSEYHTSGVDPRVGQFDPVRLLQEALAAGRLDQAVSAARPAVPLYGRVRDTLAHYRAIAAGPQAHLAAPRRALAAGDRYPDAAALHARLVQLGDLPADAAPPDSAKYDDTLADAVKAYQARNGLKESGHLDSATVAALNVPMAGRVRELELTLERLRWLPDFPAGPVIAVNLPTYRLWAFDRSDPGEPPLEMRVIVGAAARTQTPLFIGQMRYLEFNPYWNVPRSIARKELIPKLERDPGYLARSQMELVGQGGVTQQVDAAALDALRSGKLRIRQRPGPKNSLGAVKFAMPNPQDIYLHSTPQRELFQRTRRDLSHGCIRVEQPVELARFVLRGVPGWDVDEIQAAMEPGPTHRVDLARPVPVVLFYSTALAERDGTALFAPDIYHRNPKLEHALAQHAAAIEAK
jgi:L,D-transpeptidase YcbB